ncbi:MAG: acyl-CoA dehydrogenase family protein [Desulfobacteraceae bacterium]|uniref:Acyl-CoA dehydrogenase family protein n=1 Tax=Candidatus Desulfacyla euxinica TaxID=2841693 RepID=A0A8J6N048_9DELT|nr:acyl-CoA dehydrogenase family protein [Candidatus Desulfacyla euxinica]MBL6979028.1 acyl-CoA dehydrogenase family protein [Desulfobacteraceae bacterium]
MDFSLPEKILQLKEEAQDWVENVLNPLSVPLEEEERVPEELVEELRNGRFRFFGLTIPKEYGGEGWTATEWFTVLEELAKAYATVRLVAHTMNGLFWRPLLYFGTEEQKQHYLPRLATGEIWSANSLTEPEAGTGKDINSKAVKNGDEYILNGHKWLITLFPGYTKLIYAFAGTEEGITSFLVDVPNKGLVLKPMEKMMGCVGPRHYNVIYRDCRVPASNVLGEKGKGLDVAFGMLHLSRVSIAFCEVGLAQRMLDLAIDYAKRRSTFGKLLAKRQAIQNNIAQMGTEIQAARLLAYEAAWKFDQGQDIVKEAAMAKLFAEQVLIRVSEMALRIHGGIGYTKAYPLERHFRDARSFHFEEGTEEIQKLLISRYFLK